MLFDKTPVGKKLISLKCMLNTSAWLYSNRGELSVPGEILDAYGNERSRLRNRTERRAYSYVGDAVPAGECPNLADKQKKSQYGLWDGDALLSHRVAPAVPSARVGLTSGFGMGPGVPPQQESPAHKKHWLSWTSIALSAEDKKELCAHNLEEASTIFRIMGASHVKHN